MDNLLPVLWLAALLPVSVLCASGFSLARNYLAARRIGLPIRIILIDHINPFWILLDRTVLSAVKLLPLSLGNNSFIRYNYRGWEVPDRYFSHYEMGDAFILVSPGNIWVYIADPYAVTDIWRRGKKFPRDTSVTGTTVVPRCHRFPCREDVVHSRKHLIRYSNPRHIPAKYIHGKSCPLLSSLAFPCETNDDSFRHKVHSG